LFWTKGLVMSFQIPGSALGRALRSGLVRQRVAATGAQLRLRLPAQRSYSNSNANGAPEEIPAEDEAEPEPSFENSEKPARFNRNGANRGRKLRGDKPVVDVEQRKQEERALMAIAAGSRGEDGEMNNEIRGASYSRKTISMELKWLEDPRDLADRVARILRSGDPGMAAALVRQAQKDGKRTDVAWNHLLSYCMQRGFPQVAWKFYNDVSVLKH
jgi:hypothetical protein